MTESAQHFGEESCIVEMQTIVASSNGELNLAGTKHHRIDLRMPDTRIELFQHDSTCSRGVLVLDVVQAQAPFRNGGCSDERQQFSYDDRLATNYETIVWKHSPLGLTAISSPASVASLKT